MSQAAKPHLTPLTLWVMTIATGLIVANLYYNQPLLGDIAQEFHISKDLAGRVSMTTQLGYAAGMLFILPLADMHRRKRLMLIDFVFIIASLLGVAYAPNIYVLLFASFVVGASSLIPQLLVPMTAHLAKPNERGKKVGVVMSGLLIGILLSRTISGYIGKFFGWREMFIIAAGVMVVIWALIYFCLPEVEPEYKGTYGNLMKSLGQLIIKEPTLRIASIRGGLCFACFSAFWTTIVFLLRDNFNLGSDTAGLFGLVGAFGALAAGLVGRLTDKMNPFYLTAFTLVLVGLSFVIFLFSSHSIIGLVIGVIVLDMGVQATHISNQTTIFGLDAGARNRLNTVYMVTYFVGGALGAFITTKLWESFQWTGVCYTGIILSLVAICVHFLNRKSLQKHPVPAHN